MTRDAALRSVDCPTCGAGLAVLGGGRVTTHVCGYCGSELDAVEGYRVLRRFADLKRPESPFSIGMEGRLWGVAFTVIGTLGWEERDGKRVWAWADHLLYSPTHGYAWVTVEDGRLVWTRRLRSPVAPAWIGPAAVEAAEKPPTAEAAGERFRYYETSDARVTFVEGEFTWRPALGDRVRAVTLMSDRHQLHFEESASEREVSLSGWLDPAETLAAFGARALPPPAGVHPLQPLAAWRDEGFVRWVAGATAALALAGAAVAALRGTLVLPTVIVSPEEMPATLTIPVPGPGLVEVALTGFVTGGWAVIDLALEDPEDRPVFVAGREVGYWSGSDSDGSWVEDDRAARVVFRAAEAGDYALEVGVEEAGTGEGDEAGAPPPTVQVTAWAGVRSPLWLLGAALVAGAAWAWSMARPHVHRARRWRGTDWTEED